MPITKIITSTTTQVKVGAGYIRNISVPNAGTNWTMQLFDGPSGTVNNAGTLNPDIGNFGGTSAGTLTTGTLTIQPGFPMRVMVSKDLVLRPYQPLFFVRGTLQ